MRSLLFALLALPAAAALDTRPLERWLDRQEEIRTLDADFVQQRKLPALKKPVSTPGSVKMVRPGKLRWELGEPVKTIAVSDGDTTTLVDVEKREARQVPSDSPRARQFNLLADRALRGGLEGFRQAFELVESRVTDGIYQLTVRPRDRSLRGRAPWIFLDIDPSRNELRALEIQLKDESRIRTVFTRNRFNAAIPQDTFDVDLDGYRVR